MRQLQRQLQQGDVLFVECAEIPEDAKPVKRQDGKLILARGEATGHAHVIVAPDVEMYERAGVAYLRVPTPAPPLHEEHDPFPIPAGKWRIGRVQEVDPFEREVREVTD